MSAFCLFLGGSQAGKVDLANQHHLRILQALGFAVQSEGPLPVVGVGENEILWYLRSHLHPLRPAS